MDKKIKIVLDNNPKLREKSIDVNLPLSDEDKDIIFSMFEYLKLTQDKEWMEKHPNVREGIGLAAPQIGILKKMTVIHYGHDDNEVTHLLVNPKIVSTSIKKCFLKNGEGCLSVNSQHDGYSIRYYKIRVEAFDALKNKNVNIVAKGFDAIVLQHEIDHLSGILFYDRINKTNPFFVPENTEIL